jgi:hypothetical protein
MQSRSLSSASTSENFGSPRVGNAQFADYAATVVKYIYRHTTKAGATRTVVFFLFAIVL